MVRYAIFLPVRNGTRYLAQAIKSVVAQDRDDWILVILDNASTDGSADLASAFGHPRIQVRRSERSLTIYQSWHRVFTLLAEGVIQAEFATTIGHDDLLKPGFIASINRLIEEEPAATLYQTHYDMIDEQGSLIRPCRPIPGAETASDFVTARLWGLRDSVGTGYVYRPRDYVRTAGIPDLPDLLYADDLLFARLARLNFKAASRDNQCSYRLHGASTSRRLTPERIEGQIAALDFYVDALAREFPELMGSDMGRSGLASLLAREVVLMRPLANHYLLQPQTCARIRRLKSKYDAVAGGIGYKQWLGTNFVTRDVYAWSKQLMLLRVLLGSKLGRVH